MASLGQTTMRFVGYYIFATGIALSGWLSAQENGSQTGAADTVSVNANPSDSVRRKGLEFKSLARTAQGQARAGSMLVLRATVRNTAGHNIEGTLVSKLVGYEGDEFRRSFTLNADDEKTFSLPVRVPSTATGEAVEVSTTLNVVEGGREVMLMGRPDEPASQTISLPLVNSESMTAIAMEPAPPERASWRWPKTEAYATYEFAVTSRVDAGLSRTCVIVDGRPFPLSLAEWDSIDVLIIAANYVFEDASAVGVIQQFMQGGGRVWIMLDHIETSAIRGLLLDGQECETLDTVELNHFSVDINTAALIAGDRTVDCDDPVRMKRVLQQGGTVTHSIDGWPVAIWYPIGSGELLLTTLESKAWLEANSDNRSSDPRFHSNFKLPIWSAGLASSVHMQKEDSRLSEADIAYPLELIGNPVVSYQLVGTILFGFCFLLIAFGLWRILASGDLSWIGGFAPAIAIAACIPLVVVAVGKRTEIPSMITKLQWLQFSPHGGGILREMGAVYSTQNQAMKLVGHSDAIVKPSPTIESGVRMTTVEDFQRWNLSNQDWPTGTWRYETEVAVDQLPVKATAELTASGLSITLPTNLSSKLEDLVVNFSPGRTSLGKLSSGNSQLLIDGEFEATGERWTTDTIVSDEQQRRAEVYRNLLSPSLIQQVQPLRMLYGWTDLWDQSPQWNVPFEQRGAALVAIPIELSTPMAGSELYIPHCLVTIDQPLKADGISTIYRFRTGQWTDESTFAVNTSLNFVLPSEAVPLQVTAVHIEWDVQAPKRKVRLFNPAHGEIVSLAEPSIPWQTTITEGGLLEDLRDGRLELQIEIADLDGLTEAEKNSFVSWRIKHLRVSVSGRKLPQDNLSVEVLPSGPK